MRVNFNRPFKGYDGKDIEDENGGKQLIREAVCARLYTSSEGLSPDEKYEAYKLMARIASSDGEIDIEDRESLLIKKICESTLTAGGYGQIVELLNGR